MRSVPNTTRDSTTIAKSMKMWPTSKEALCMSAKWIKVAHILSVGSVLPFLHLGDHVAVCLADHVEKALVCEELDDKAERFSRCMYACIRTYARWMAHSLPLRHMILLVNSEKASMNPASMALPFSRINKKI
jgi:hypothetical protein